MSGLEVGSEKMFNTKNVEGSILYNFYSGRFQCLVIEQVGKKAVGPGLVAGVLVAGEAATCLCCASAGEGLP